MIVVEIPGVGPTQFEDEKQAEAFFNKGTAKQRAISLAVNDPNVPEILKTFLSSERSNSVIPKALDSLDAGVESFTNSYTGNLSKKVGDVGSYLANKLTGGDQSYSDISKGRETELADKQSRSPITSGVSSIVGLIAPNSLLSGALKAGQATASAAGLSKVIETGAKAKPFLEGLLRGGIGNTIYGQVSADADTSLKDRGVKAGIDFTLGGLLDASLNKTGAVITNKIAKARAPQEAQKILSELNDRFATIEDPALRAKAIQEYLQNASSAQSAKVGGSGERIKTALEDEMNSSSQGIKDFYKEFTKGNKTPSQVKNAKTFLTDFFRQNGFIDAKGNWIDEAGNVVSEPVTRYGAGGTTEAQQKFLFERAKDFIRNPNLDRLHGIRKAIGTEAYGGPSPLFPGNTKATVKGLESAIRADEEAAIRSTYGDDIANEFLSKKAAFKEVAGPIKALGKKIGIVNDSGEFIINKAPEDLIKRISKLSPEEYQKILPILEKQGVLNEFPEISRSLQNVNALEKVGSGYQRLGTKLSNDPEFFKAVENLKGNFPAEALDQIKGDYLQRLIERAGGNNQKLAKELDKLAPSAKKLLFSPEEVVMLENLQKQASIGSDKSFISNLLSYGLKGKINIPNHLIDPAIQATPDNIINFIKRAAEIAQKRAGAPVEGAAARGLSEAINYRGR